MRDRDEEREDAETFGERRADERATELAVGGRRIAQRAREEVAEDETDADGGGAHADGGKTSADVLGCNRIHLNAPSGVLWATICCCGASAFYQWPG